MCNTMYITADENEHDRCPGRPRKAIPIEGVSIFSFLKAVGTLSKRNACHFLSVMINHGWCKAEETQ